jgi:hypothetical protein
MMKEECTRLVSIRVMVDTMYVMTISRLTLDYSYQKDKRAKHGNLPKIKALSDIGEQ